MHIICLIKFISDVDNFRYDYERHVLIRNQTEQILNPDDATALAYALGCKQKADGITVELVTMGPRSVLESVRDLLRAGVDRATILSDKRFVGSDTYVTSLVLGTYLKQSKFDMILTGTRALDGDTAHVPAQVAELLGLEHMSYIKSFEKTCFSEMLSVFNVETDGEVLTYEMALPAVCSLTREAQYKLPFVRYEDLELDVDDRIKFLSNEELKLPADWLGLDGSLTKVSRAYAKEFIAKEQIVVQVDDAGIERTYQFLSEKGYV